MARVAHGLLAGLALVFLVTFAVQAGPQLSVQALVQDPNRYNGKVVTVVGTITAYRERASESGNFYTTFRLTDGDASVTVFTWNKQNFGNGQKVRVTGTFAKARSVGTVAFDNEIQAHRIDIVP
jgi:DNA polymerase III alpha subunit